MILYVMQESSYLSKLALVSIWFRRVCPNNNFCMSRFTHFDIPIKYQNKIGITTLIPIIKFFGIHMSSESYEESGYSLDLDL